MPYSSKPKDRLPTPSDVAAKPGFADRDDAFAPDSKCEPESTDPLQPPADSEGVPASPPPEEKDKRHEPFARAAREDDDGYDPWSDRPAAQPLWEEDPWR